VICWGERWTGLVHRKQDTDVVNHNGIFRGSRDADGAGSHRRSEVVDGIDPTPNESEDTVHMDRNGPFAEAKHQEMICRFHRPCRQAEPLSTVDHRDHRASNQGQALDCAGSFRNGHKRKRGQDFADVASEQAETMSGQLDQD
jgi:hypothetical protein